MEGGWRNGGGVEEVWRRCGGGVEEVWRRQVPKQYEVNYETIWKFE